jgi:hypothetical protein
MHSGEGRRYFSSYRPDGSAPIWLCSKQASRLRCPKRRLAASCLLAGQPPLIKALPCAQRFSHGQPCFSEINCRETARNSNTEPSSNQAGGWGREARAKLDGPHSALPYLATSSFLMPSNLACSPGLVFWSTSCMRSPWRHAPLTFAWRQDVDEGFFTKALKPS